MKIFFYVLCVFSLINPSIYNLLKWLEVIFENIVGIVVFSFSLDYRSLNSGDRYCLLGWLKFSLRTERPCLHTAMKTKFMFDNAFLAPKKTAFIQLEGNEKK